MSEAEDDDGKTFEPTEKKLREAAEKGDLPVSREAPLLAALAATLVVCSLTLRSGAGRLADTLAHLLEDPARWHLGNGADAAELIGVLLGAAAGLVVPIFAIFVVAGLAVSFAQNAPSVVLHRIAPKLDKISPLAAGAEAARSEKRLVRRCSSARASSSSWPSGFVVFLLLAIGASSP